MRDGKTELQLPWPAGTVKSYLLAVRHTQISLGLGDPRIGEMPQLEYTIKGLKKKAAAGKQTRLPITPPILRQLKQVWEQYPNHRDASTL